MHHRFDAPTPPSPTVLLSIPVTWDFSMHPLKSDLATLKVVHYFQFPLLGIFPCTLLLSRNLRVSCSLSIPVTWDFSMHRNEYRLRVNARTTSFNSRYLGFFHAPPNHTRMISSIAISLSIPVTWDFSMHLSTRSCQAFN